VEECSPSCLLHPLPYSLLYQPKSLIGLGILILYSHYSTLQSTTPSPIYSTYSQHCSTCSPIINLQWFIPCFITQLGYKDKCSWGSSGYGQPPDGVLPCVGEVPRWCTTPGYDTYIGCTWTHHLIYTDRATWPGYVTYTFGVAPSVQSLHGNPFPLSYTNHGL